MYNRPFVDAAQSHGPQPTYLLLMPLSLTVSRRLLLEELADEVALRPRRQQRLAVVITDLLQQQQSVTWL